MSQRDVLDVAVEDRALDIQAVVDAVGMPVSIFASAASVQPALFYATRHPDRIEKLVLHNGFARLLDLQPEESWRGLSAMARTNFTLVAQALTGRAVSLEHDQATVEAHVASTTGEEAARSLLATMPADVTPILRDVTAQTLVVHYADLSTIPFKLGQQLAARIPGARLVPLRFSSGDQWLETMVSVIDPFLPRTTDESIALEESQNASTFRTVLFTDLVGHTAMMSRLGDERGRDVLREHERITREVLKAHGGTEVKTMGDGFMASFGSVTKAVECAVALQRAFAERQGEPLTIRVGLNAGEPIEEDGDLFGATVILASRIAAKAGAGEILVADTVRGLCSGKGFLFAGCGEFVAKGFEEPVRVYEVSWRD